MGYLLSGLFQHLSYTSSSDGYHLIYMRLIVRCDMHALAVIALDNKCMRPTGLGPVQGPSALCQVHLFVSGPVAVIAITDRVVYSM